MKQTTFLLLCMLFVMSSACSKKSNNPAKEEKFISGKVERLSPGTDKNNSFMVLLQSADDKTYEVIVNDTTLIKSFTLNKNATFKGEVTGNIMFVTKIISTDNDNFKLQGIIKIKENNRSGYTAMVNSSVNEEFVALFSITNLANSYKEYSKGDTLSVSGELWTDGYKLNLTVKGVNR
ncbi:MAG: hypothetical protein N4A72_21780 [Bacteroidales bacterium]|nr:hypothetical protein [Bacteroidales bacterium]